MGQRFSGQVACKRPGIETINRLEEIPSRIDSSTPYSQGLSSGPEDIDSQWRSRWHGVKRAGRKQHQIILRPYDTPSHTLNPSPDSAAETWETNITCPTNKLDESKHQTMPHLDGCYDCKDLIGATRLENSGKDPDHAAQQRDARQSVQNISLGYSVQTVDSQKNYGPSSSRHVTDKTLLSNVEEIDVILCEEQGRYGSICRTFHISDEELFIIQRRKSSIQAVQCPDDHISPSHRATFSQGDLPSTQSKTLSGQKSDECLFLLQRTSSPRSTQSSLISQSKGSSSRSSPTSESNDIYRISLLSNFHYCTYGCAGKIFKRKADWICHEEQIHDPPNLYTCLLHVSDSLSTDPCPSNFCVSVMNSEHLAHFHDSLSCFDKSATSIERYQSNSPDSLLKHLRDQHALPLEKEPDYWRTAYQSKGWYCGFCGGKLRTWRERADHISIHFTREGATMEDWQEVNISQAARDAKGAIENSAKDSLQVRAKRLSMVEEVECACLERFPV